MSFGSIIYFILFQPLQTIFEMVYGIAYLIIGYKGLSIIALSLAINFLVLPLYRRADKMQEEERDIEARLQDGVAHIKKTFKGDERMMMLQTYYRQNNYKPTYVLRGATSLFLQIPFFIAAYRFLSGLNSLNGVSFGLISDLSKPDALLTVFGVSINLLPIIMTAINFISSAIYSKNFPTKTKVQLYVTALFFLVFLYKSPSGLVFYWTLNNAFSLLKTITLKQKNPAKLAKSLIAIGGIVISVLSFFNTNEESIYLLYIGIALVFPLLFELVKNKTNNKADSKKSKKKKVEIQNNHKLFMAGCFFMTALIGLLIPSAVINSSPQEFVFVSDFKNPLWYVASSFFLAFGMFVVWLNVFYWLANKKAKVVFDKVIWIICGVSIINYMFFGKNMGTLSSTLKYTTATGTIGVPSDEILLNLIVVVVVVIAFALIYRLLNKKLFAVLVVCVIALTGMSVANIVGINSSISKITPTSQSENEYNISLSKNNKNVVVLMLDRAMGYYIPYFMNEKSELAEKFDGFTYYSNTVSFGGHTNFASPAFFGGYEYTPIEINSRDTETIPAKHNEALKVMPKIFSQNGFHVTIYNPNYAGYQWIPDLSIYDDLENVTAYKTGDSFIDDESKTAIMNNRLRNIFVYGVMKSSPVFIQSTIYNNGRYFGSDTSQNYFSIYKAQGKNSLFINAYSMLSSLSSITSAEDSENGNVLIMTNDTTHEGQLLQEPDYEAKDQVDNEQYYQDLSRFTLDGKTLEMSDLEKITSYQDNMAAIIQLGKWFDYLREIGVYDNTKIIIASDHGYCLDQIKGYTVEDDGRKQYLEYFMPLLLVKDFNSTGFKTSDEFMTNADIPTMALDNVIEDKTNPYTGKQINNDEKFAHDQYIIYSEDWITDRNNGNQFLPADWYTVHDSIWNINNWDKVAKNQVLTNKDVK